MAHLHNDFHFAQLLQQQFELEASQAFHRSPTNSNHYPKSPNRHQQRSKQEDGRSLIDPSWELVDPTPDVHLLFQLFNRRFFWNALGAVCVEWSRRMTLCAGVCCYQGRGGMCRITLSEPLLKLRPRKDLVETLLHEMIHAYLFVTHNNRDRDGHGPEFHSHMWRINKEAGTNITVYHSFHDEVRMYQQHWWRCNGPCQTRRPFFGMVRRAMNRAPGKQDRWWAEHQSTCGGTFIKVKEPEKQTKSKSTKSNTSTKPSSPNKDIRSYFPITGTKPGKSPVSSPTKTKPSPTKNQDIRSFLPDVKKPTASGTLRGLANVFGFSNLPNNNTNTCCGSGTKNRNGTVVLTKTTSSAASTSSTPSVNTFAGKGYKVSGSNNGQDVRSAVRNHWASKFADEPSQPKRFKTENENDDVIAIVKCPVCSENFEERDIESHIDLCLSQVDIQPERQPETIPCLICNLPVPKDCLNAHLDDCMGDEIFDGVGEVEGESASNGSDNGTLDNESDADKKYNCPVCTDLYRLADMSGHLEECFASENTKESNDNVVNSLLSVNFD